MSSSEEKTPTVSPDQGTTGETTTSSENKEAGMQTGLSEEEKKAHWDEIECNAIMGMMNSLKARNPEAYQDIIIETLYKQFARENRATRSKETIFSELDRHVTLLKEARAQFGREMECAVILYIDKHKGEHYCLGCMGRRDKP